MSKKKGGDQPDKHDKTSKMHVDISRVNQPHNAKKESLGPNTSR